MSTQIDSILTLVLYQFIQLAFIGGPTILALWLLRTRWIEHLPRKASLLEGRWRGWATGAGSALAAALISILPALILGGYSHGAGWQAFEYSLAPSAGNNAASLVLLFLVQSLFEEALFRGVGLALLAMLLMWMTELLFIPAEQRRFGTRSYGIDTPEVAAWRTRAWVCSGLLATVVLAVGFGAVHAGNPSVSKVALVNIVLAGLWLGLLFWHRGSLVAPWAAHFLWNAMLAVLGLPVSGFALLHAPLGAGIEGARAGLLAGGQFGPEGSLLCTAAFALLTAWLTHSTLSQLRTNAMTTSSDSDIDAARRTG